MRAGPRVLGVAMLMATALAVAGCGSSGGSDGANGGPETTVAAGPGGSSSSDGGGGQAAATSVDDACKLLDDDAIQAAYGGESAKVTVTESMTPKTAKNCQVTVAQPVKVMNVGPDEIITNVSLSLHAVATSEADFDSNRPTSAKAISPATKKAFWENDQYNRHIVWFDQGVRYELVFLTPGDAVDKAKGFATMQELSKDIIAKT